MTGLDALLRDLLVDDLFVAFSIRYNRQLARLKESGRDAKLKRVDIYDIPIDSVLLKIDKSKPPITLFKTGKGQRKRCDYILFTEMNGVKYMLFIELKSKKVKKHLKQFKGSECIIDYCDATLNRFYNQNNLLQTYEKRFVLFYKFSINKKKTRPQKPTIKNDTPEKAYRYPNPIMPSLKSLLFL